MSGAPIYLSKPTEVEAIQWTGDNLEAVEQFGVKFRLGPPPHELRIRAGADGAQGLVPVPVGHWVVRAKGVMNDHWPVADEYFHAKYDGPLICGKSGPPNVHNLHMSECRHLRGHLGLHTWGVA